MNGKVSLFAQLLHDSGENTAGSFPVSRKASLSRAFFHMDSVQEDLKNLDESDRKDTIRNIRLAMGYSEDEADKLAQVDAQQEALWQKG